ncbi:MAG: glycosyltransferase, partial [Thermoanaerobaculia bacterium]|nr:glycosyltransferase [Thermoanaerobaculia bacterium]
MGRTIASVRAQLPEVEIVVVGRDEPGALAGSDVRFLESERVLNPAEARNAGCRAAQGDVFLFIDADCTAEPGWAERHLEAQGESPGIVGGAVTFDRSGYWATADNISSFHFLLPDADDDRGLASLNLSVARGAFELLGGFDEELPPAEDLDFSLRARKYGVDVRFEPAALVRHEPARAGLGDLLRHARWYGAIFPVFLERY